MNSRVICLLFTPIVLSLTPLLKAGDLVSRYAIYRSEDKGRTWTASGAGLPVQFRINAFGALGESIVAGTDSGIYYSFDAGKSWQESALPLPDHARVTSVAALQDRYFAGTTAGVLLYSSDQGETWQVREAFPRHNIRSLHVMGGRLYAGMDAAAVYESADLGQSWNQLAAGLPPQSQVLALTSQEGRLFAGLYARGLFFWSASERKWRASGAAAGIKPLALAALGGTLVAGHNPGGIYWSEDLGEIWNRWQIGSRWPGGWTDPFQSVDPHASLDAPVWELSAANDRGIAGAGGAIYYSEDRGRSWTRAQTGLPATSPGIGFLIRGDLTLAAIHQKAAACAGE